MKFNFLLNSKTNKKGENPIYLRISHNYKSVDVRTQLTITPKFWDNDKKKAKNTNQFRFGYEINSRLSEIESESKKIYYRLKDDLDSEPELSVLKKQIELELFKIGVEEVKKHNLITYFDTYINQLDGKINKSTGKPISATYIKVYKRTFTILKSFLNDTKIGFEFDSIDETFFDAYVEYLRKLDYATNTIGQHVKNVKTVVISAFDRNLHSNRKYKVLQVYKEDTPKIALSDDVLKDMYELDLSSKPRLEKVRDVFIIGCYTGLRSGDLKDFSKKAKIVLEKNIIYIKTEKTEKEVPLPIHRYTKEILLKYQNNIPTISNVKFNAYIKEVAKLLPALSESTELEITKGGKRKVSTEPIYQQVTTHTARRSFATNLFKKGLPAETIMQITGHKNLDTFYKYIKLPKDYSVSLINKIFNEN